MADGIGETRDRVELKLNGYPLILAKTYSISLSLFEVPSIFSLTLGIPAPALAAVLSKIPPRLSFELSIDGRLQFEGRIDAVMAERSASGTSLTIRGRDGMQDLVDRYITAEQSFKGSTIVELVETALETVYGAGNWELQFSAAIAKRRITGDDSLKQSASADAVEEGLGDGDVFIPVSPTSAATKLLKAQQTYQAIVDSSTAADGPAVANQFAASQFPLFPGIAEKDLLSALQNKGVVINTGSLVTVGGGANKPPEPTVQAKLGERWFDGVVKPELDRAGLFLYYVGNGIFVLSATDPQAPALYRIECSIGAPFGQHNNIVSARWTNDTTRRFTSATVHARNGGGAEKRENLADIVTDAEMVALGYNRPFTRKDTKSKKLKQAQFLALKHLCEGRRQGRRLEYTFSGHTTIGVSGKRICWAHDTVVDVDDKLFGVSGPFYIESVEHTSHPEKTTTLRLMRPEDCLFGESAGADGEL